MDAAKVEVALPRDVGNVDWDAEAVADSADLGGDSWVVDCGEDEGVCWCCFGSDILYSRKGPGDVCDLVCVGGEAVLDLRVEWVRGD